MGGRGTVVLDGDGQLGSGFIAIGIAHRVGEDIGHDGWCAWYGRGCHIGIAAIGIQRQFAVGTGNFSAYIRSRRAATAGHHSYHGGTTCRPAVSPWYIVAQHIVRDGLTLCDTLGVINRGRHIVNDLNRQGTRGGLRRCALVGNEQGNAIGRFCSWRCAVVLALLQGVGVAHLCAGGCAAIALLVGDAGNAQFTLPCINHIRRIAH